jgi:hypothetical protein
MKYLCLAYGDEKDWHALTKAEQEALLANDEVLRERGGLVGAVKPEVTTVRAWDGTPELSERPFAAGRAPLAGFSVIEASDLDEAVRLVKDTPCARAKGAIEVRPLLVWNGPE